MELTKKQAKEFSIKKWEYIVKNNGNSNDLVTNIPELKVLNNQCGYCQKYVDTISRTLNDCAECPIRPKIKDYDDYDFLGCSQFSHPYNVWGKNPTKENAQLLLDLIKNS